mmetsp:Transcript_23395/g.34692  ORF Transcript_23395/g.34692 Transcript_23395/m.34692 type:complete len:1119 (-) Transcript_23395:69-3425(-)
MVGSIKNRIAAFENMAVQSKSSGKIMDIVPPSPGFSGTKKVGQMHSKGKEILGYVPLVTKPNGTNSLVNGRNPDPDPDDKRQLGGRDHRDQNFNEDLDIYNSFKMNKKKRMEESSSVDHSEKENSHSSIDVDAAFSGPVNEVNVSSESERDGDEERNQQTISPLSFQGSQIDSTRESSAALKTAGEHEPETLDQIAEEEVAENGEDDAQLLEPSDVQLLPLNERCDIDGANDGEIVSDTRSNGEKTCHSSDDSGEFSDPKAKSENSINSGTGNIIDISVASEDDPFADDFKEMKRETQSNTTSKDHKYFSDRAELIQANMDMDSEEKDFDLFISNDSTDDDDNYFNVANQDEDDANSFTAYLEDLQPVPSTRNLVGDKEMEPAEEMEPEDLTNEDHTTKATLPEERSADSKCMTYSHESGETNQDGANSKESFGCENGKDSSTFDNNLHNAQDNSNVPVDDQELVAAENPFSKEIGDVNLLLQHDALPESETDLKSFDDQNNSAPESTDHHPFPSSSEIGEIPEFAQTEQTEQAEHGESLVEIHNTYANELERKENFLLNDEDERNNSHFGDVFAENIAYANGLNREEASFPFNEDAPNNPYFQDGVNEMNEVDDYENFQQLTDDSTHEMKEDMQTQHDTDRKVTASHFIFNSDEIKGGDNVATSDETRETFSDDDYDDEIIQNVYKKVDSNMNNDMDERILGLDEHEYVEIMDEADDDESALIGVEIDDESMASDSQEPILIKVFPSRETTLLRHDGNDYLKQPIQLTPIDESQDNWNEETNEDIQMQQQNPPPTVNNPALFSQNDDALSQITEDSYESESPAIKWELAEAQDAATKPISHQSLMTYSVTTTSYDSIIENKPNQTRPIFRQSNSLHQNKRILGKNPGIKLDPIISDSPSNISEITDPEQSFRKQQSVRKRPTFPTTQQKNSNREVVVLSTISGGGGKKSLEANTNSSRRRRTPSPFSRKNHSNRTNHSGGKASTNNDHERGRERNSSKKSRKFSIRSLSPFRKRKSKNEMDEISTTSAYKGPMSRIESSPRPRLARTPSEIMEEDEAKETVVPLVAITSSDDSSQFRKSRREKKAKKKFSFRSLSPFRRRSKKSSRPDPFDEDGESV